MKRKEGKIIDFSFRLTDQLLILAWPLQIGCVTMRKLPLGSLSLFEKVLFYLFLLCWVLVACGLLSSCSKCGQLSGCRARSSYYSGFSYCGAWILGWEGFSSCHTWAQSLWPTGLIAPRHVGSSWNRDRTRVSYTGRQILYHWDTRGAPVSFFFLIY